MSIRVTAEDTESGEGAEQIIEAGNYVIVCAAPCRLVGEVHHANGTSVLTLKGRDSVLLQTRLVSTD